MSCYLSTTLELAFTTANLRLYDPLRNIDTYPLDTFFDTSLITIRYAKL